MISDEDKNRVRAATDLVALVQETVELRPRGHEFWGCCPFHGEKTPSFHIIPATQVWHCFGCGEGGDCFTYIMKRENLSFPESIRYLAERAGIELQKRPLRVAVRSAHVLSKCARRRATFTIRCSCAARTVADASILRAAVWARMCVSAIDSVLLRAVAHSSTICAPRVFRLAR